MNPIITINPDEVLENSNALFFMLVWTSSQGTFFGNGNGSFQNALHGPMNSPVIERNNIVKEYYRLVDSAQSDQLIKDGRIDILPLPLFSE